MLSIQTNIPSLIAQENLRINSNFQAQTIERLTSGYRINSSADDAAGLVVANQYRSSVSELTQGVRNANDGASTLQIVDGGLSNISTMLDRMKTLATESASGTFQGNRTTLDNEYQQLKGEITRQATDIGLVAGGANATNMSVYIGGGPNGGNLSNSEVGINLSGSYVDTAGLGLANTSVSGDTGVSFAGAPNVSTGTFLATTAATYEVHTANGTYTATVGGTGTAQTAQALVASLNQQLAGSGVSAAINSNSGAVEFSGGAFAITSTNGATLTGTDATDVGNAAMFNQNNIAWGGAVTGAAQNIAFTLGSTTTTVNLGVGVDAAGAVTAINQAMNSQGVYAFVNHAGTIDIQGASAFSTTMTVPGGSSQGFTAQAATAAATPTITGSGTAAATNAITAINNALANLGTVQGVVGAGENKLNYATQLAESQISNFSAAESQIRDADMAAEAANLTKAQVLQQASLAAMAQANAAPQAILALLK